MKTRKELAELVAMLATRGSGITALGIANDARVLERFSRTAERNAEDYCNVPNHDFESRARQILEKVNRILAAYRLRATHTGDPRGYCLRLWSTDPARPLRGNTWGGDESGYGI